MVPEIKPSLFKLDKTLGYRYALVPNHPCGNVSQGKVYEHVYVIARSIGRPLNIDEVVHHIDRDKANNEFSNLLLLTYSQHNRLHLIEDYGVVFKKVTCPICSKGFETTDTINQKYCSSECSTRGRRKFDVDPNTLAIMLWEMPTVDVAKHFGVSDVAIAKRAKVLGLSKPPRGYWAKVKAGRV